MSGHLPAVVVYSENHMSLTAFNFVNDELNELKKMNEKP